MRILVLMNLVAPKTGGVVDKIFAKCDHLKKLGHDVCFLPSSGNLHDQKERFKPFFCKGADPYFEICEQAPKDIISKIRRLALFVKVLKSSQVDIIYYRYTPSIRTILGLLLAGIPYVQEHNTIEIEEMRKFGKRRGILIDKTFGLICRFFSRGLVAVTPEILDYQVGRSGRQKPGIVISNSVDINKYPCKERKLPNRKRLVFIGNISYWHGLDRILPILSDLSGFSLTIIGVGKELPDIEKAVKSLGLEDRVCFLGRMRGDDLQREMMECDLAISSLAIHRIGIRQASPIKTRHYLALGLPVVIGYEDVGLEPDLPFVMRVPAEETALDAEALKEFYNEMIADKDICRKARDYAERKLSTRGKMKELEAFMMKIMGEKQDG